MDEPTKRAAEAARTIQRTIEGVVFLAAPKVVERLPILPSREALLEIVDGYLVFLEQAGHGSMSSGKTLKEATFEGASRLRSLISAWTPVREVPPEIEEAARALVEAIGVPAPPGGWSEFDGRTNEPEPRNDNAKGLLKKSPVDPQSPFLHEVNFVLSVLFALASPRRLDGLAALPSEEETEAALAGFARHAESLGDDPEGARQRQEVTGIQGLLGQIRGLRPGDVPREVTLEARRIFERLFHASREKWDADWARQERR